MVNNGVSTFSGKTILLKNNLNLGGEEWMPIGIGTRDGSTYTGNAFKGTFDGNGKTISGLKISERSNSAGLIGVLDGGTVKNVTLEVDIDVASKANELAAGCVGLLTNNGLIENVTVNGSVKSEKAAAGIVSRVLKSGTVRNCHNHATVSGTSYNIGGIVGIVCAISEKDDTIVLETGSDRTKIRFRRTAIASVEKLDMGGKDTTPAKK